jgi:hypothetical protein
VLRHPGLAQAEPIDELADRPLALTEEVEDAATLGLGEDVEGVHGGSSHYQTFI